MEFSVIICLTVLTKASEKERTLEEALSAEVRQGASLQQQLAEASKQMQTHVNLLQELEERIHFLHRANSVRMLFIIEWFNKK